MKRYFKYLSTSFHQSLQRPYFGFTQGHSYLSSQEVTTIRNMVGKQNPGVVAEFENQFAKLIGDGQAISYASGRMGFYDLMCTLDIGGGDEVILLGATCAVMVNAVLKTGAKPVFSDIDINTFGSEVRSIKNCISRRTKMIVAQHSFGIPCDIMPILELAQSKRIFLLEDCALSVGSALDGKKVGDFGHAALFSTDNSKPLNTLIGGLIYTANADLADQLRRSQKKCPQLSLDKQQALWRQFLLERRFCNPRQYGLMGIIDAFFHLKRKIFHSENPFLSEDFGASHNASYPYPAKIPSFLAALGLIEVQRWPKVASERKALLKKIIEVLDQREGMHLPRAYTNKRWDIVPLRFAWFQSSGAYIRHALKDVVHVPWTWFMTPIVATSEPLDRFGYCAGSAPVSESVGPDMINLPCNICHENHEVFLNCLKKALK